jgi:hypothetical protein
MFAAFTRGAELAWSIAHACFWKHPQSVNETYLQHCAAALAICLQLGFASFAAFVHAFLPCCFESTASNIAGAITKSVALRQKRVD